MTIKDLTIRQDPRKTDRLRYRIRQAIHNIERSEQTEAQEHLNHLARAGVELRIAVELLDALYKLEKEASR